MNNSIYKKVIDLLEANGHIDESLELQRNFYMISSNNYHEKIKSLDNIVGFCHMRSFGDLSIKGMNGWKWHEMLTKLKKYAEKKFKHENELTDYIIILLNGIVNLFELSSELVLADKFKRLKKQLLENPEVGIFEIISIYSGANSFNDLILHKNEDMLLQENNLLDFLRSKLFDSVIKLREYKN